MQFEKFEEKLNNKEYEELENELYKEWIENKDLMSKYQLGICYGEQYEKRNEAIKIFKQLMETECKYAYMYSFVAKHAHSNIESAKIIKEGLRFFSDSSKLNNQLIDYLENEEKEQHFIELDKKNILNVHTIMQMISYYFENDFYTKANELYKAKKEIIEKEDYPSKCIEFIGILLTYLSNEKVNLEEITSFIVSDNNTIYGIILRLIEMDIVSDKDISKSKKLLKQISYRVEYADNFIELINFSKYSVSCFTIDKVLFYIIEKLITKFENTEEQRKLELIRDLHYIYWNGDNVTKSELRNIEKKLKEELESTENEEIHNYLLDIYERLGNKKKYFTTFVDILKNSKNVTDLYINLNNFKETDMDDAVEYICENVRIYSFLKNTYQDFICTVIQKLFEMKKYGQIVKIIDKIDYRQLDYLKFGFELAYSLNNQKRTKEAKELYEEYLNVHPDSSAAKNNLGVIYEKEGDLETALTLFQMAESLSHEEIHIKNIERCSKTIKQKKKDEEKFAKALLLFEQESIWVINELKLFYAEADENNNVICPYKRLPSLLKCSQSKGEELLNLFLTNNYISKNTNHNYDTMANVYTINVGIKNKMKELENENLLVSSFIDNFNNFTIDNLRNLDYIKINQKLSSINNDKIKNIFVRDFNELVYNYLSNQLKTVILMGGSIIELLLLHTLDKNNIVKYKINSKNKKVLDMDMSQMLEVCTNENLIHNTPQKFIDGIKFFRNYVHPGKELREDFEIDRQTVDLLMAIVRWLILAIDFD